MPFHIVAFLITIPFLHLLQDSPGYWLPVRLQSRPEWFRLQASHMPRYILSSSSIWYCFVSADSHKQTDKTKVREIKCHLLSKCPSWPSLLPGEGKFNKKICMSCISCGKRPRKSFPLKCLRLYDEKRLTFLSASCSRTWTWTKDPLINSQML